MRKALKCNPKGKRKHLTLKPVNGDTPEDKLGVYLGTKTPGDLFSAAYAPEDRLIHPTRKSLTYDMETPTLSVKSCKIRRMFALSAFEQEGIFLVPHLP
jgi:hypothetical protein